MTSDLGNTVVETQSTGDSTRLSEWRENKLQLSQRLQREDMYSHAAKSDLSSFDFITHLLARQ